MTDVVIPASTWRELSLPAKVRLRWRLQARPKQLTPGQHHLCLDPARCHELEREAWTLYPRKGRRWTKARDAWLLERGHVTWTTWLILSGRGWGKTRTGAEDTVKYMLEHPGCRVALVAATYADGRNTMVEGESGMLALLPSSLIENWNRSMGELVLTNGSRAQIFTAEKPDRLRGPQHHRAWCDELAAWQYLQKTWDQLMFGLRLGDHPQVIITTTPRPLKFLRRLVAKSREHGSKIIITTGHTSENAENLADAAVEALYDTYSGTRLGRQELDGEILDDYEGGLIQQHEIDSARVEMWQVPDLLEGVLGRIVIGVDPAVTSRETSDETGIVAAGLSAGACPICPRSANPRGKQHVFVLEDASPGIVSNLEWAAVTARTYRRWHADRVVGEVNNGGDLVETVLLAAEPWLPVKTVHASKGKVVRAEPVGALYQKGMVHHVGHWDTLETQLTSLGVEGEDEPEPGEEEAKSPDRADACVWAITELMIPDDPVKVIGVAQDTRGRGAR